MNCRIIRKQALNRSIIMIIFFIKEFEVVPLVAVMSGSEEKRKKEMEVLLFN